MLSSPLAVTLGLDPRALHCRIDATFGSTRSDVRRNLLDPLSPRQMRYDGSMITLTLQTEPLTVDVAVRATVNGFLACATHRTTTAATGA